jgi:hypothetical protein
MDLSTSKSNLLNETLAISENPTLWCDEVQGIETGFFFLRSLPRLEEEIACAIKVLLHGCWRLAGTVVSLLNPLLFSVLTCHPVGPVQCLPFQAS